MMAAILYPFVCLVIGASLAAAEEDQTIVTIPNVYLRPQNPKTFATTPKKICYPHLGCFINDDHIPHPCLPDEPDNINVKLHLNTRKAPATDEATPGHVHAEVLHWRRPETIRNSSFDGSKPTIIAVHGFLRHVDEAWLVDLADLSLKMDDMNVIRVGWYGGAMTANYPQAVCNTRVVGAEVAKLVEQLQHLGQDLDGVWLVGHSLGAHIMGFAGRRMPQIGRITGLDPAEPYFENRHVDARLDPSDAQFVDVIHTDGSSILANGGTGGFGSKQPMGHVDFYPNGGQEQPGCRKLIGDISGIGDMKRFVICNHKRATKIFNEALRAKAEGRSCRFKAHPCDSYEKYLREECQDCGVGCSLIGPDAVLTRPKTKETRVQMYLLTTGEAPFCGERFFDLTAKLPAGFKRDRGSLFYRVTTRDNQTIEQEVTAAADDELEPERTLHRVVIRGTDIDIRNIKDLEVKYHHYWALHNPKTWWGGPIKFEVASIAPLDAKTEKPLEEERIEFCQAGRKAITLEKDKWTKIHRC